MLQKYLKNFALFVQRPFSFYTSAHNFKRGHSNKHKIANLKITPFKMIRNNNNNVSSARNFIFTKPHLNGKKPSFLNKEEVKTDI